MESLSNNRNEIIKCINSLDCIKKGNFTLKSGIQSNYYVNLRNLISEPLVMKKICELIYQKLPTEEEFYICGLPYAGMPYATGVSILYDIPLLVLRKETKKYGMQNLIDGLENKRNISKVIIIDDIFTTGSSIRDSIPIMEKQGLEVIQTIVIVDRSESNIESGKNAVINKSREGVAFLFSLTEILEFSN